MKTSVRNSKRNIGKGTVPKGTLDSIGVGETCRREEMRRQIEIQNGKEGKETEKERKRKGKGTAKERKGVERKGTERKGKERKRKEKGKKGKGKEKVNER